MKIFVGAALGFVAGVAIAVFGERAEIWCGRREWPERQGDLLEGEVPSPKNPGKPTRYNAGC